jgi:ABC-2 type transport system permease protein
MKNPFRTSFAAVFWNEVLLNTKRVAPYVMMIFFSSNAVLWWGWGPAVERGWATNSEVYIQRNFGAFSFILGLPIFTAIMMGDIVTRDYRLGVDPLIFSRPVSRAAYLLGKFGGNFFVLVCCQSAFAITFFLLQWVPFSGMVRLPVRVLPFLEHFFFIVVISHLTLAAFYFAAGTLTRNAKVVYGLAACFYPVYVALQLTLKELPTSFHVIFDPMGFNLNAGTSPDLWRWTADAVNRYVVEYSLNSYVNRAWMIVVSAGILLIVCLRFRTAPSSSNTLNEAPFTWVRLSTPAEAIPNVTSTLASFDFSDSPVDKSPARERVTVTLPKVTSARGLSATLSKIQAAVGVEFRLMQAERSVLIIVPLAIFLSLLDVALYRGVPEISYSVTLASATAKGLQLFLVAMIVFFVGEAMHRDREVKVEPVVWSTPTPNSVLLLSKFLAITALALSMVVVVSLCAIVVQFVRGQTPVDLSTHVVIQGVVVVPSVVFLTAFAIALNVVFRNKYLTYVVATALGAGLFYLYNTSYNHWLYNPLLHRLWRYPDLTTPAMLTNRLYCFGLAAVSLVLAHLFFERKSR